MAFEKRGRFSVEHTMQCKEERAQLKTTIKRCKQLIGDARDTIRNARKSMDDALEQERPMVMAEHVRVRAVMTDPAILAEFAQEETRVLELLERYRAQINEQHPSAEWVSTPDYVYYSRRFYKPNVSGYPGEAIEPPILYNFVNSKGLGYKSIPNPEYYKAAQDQSDAIWAYWASQKVNNAAIRAARRRLWVIDRMQLLEQHSPLCDDLSRMICEDWL